MARNRTTPTDLPTVTITTDRILNFGVVMEYNADGSPNTDSIVFQYEIEHVDSNGKRTGIAVERIAFADWTTAVKTDLKAIRDKVLVDAENKGHIGAGTDSDDLS